MTTVDSALQDFEARITTLESMRKKADARDDTLLAGVRENRELIIDTRKDLSDMNDVVIETRSEVKIVGSTVSAVLKKVETVLKRLKANGR